MGDNKTKTFTIPDTRSLNDTQEGFTTKTMMMMRKAMLCTFVVLSALLNSTHATREQRLNIGRVEITRRIDQLKAELNAEDNPSPPELLSSGRDRRVVADELVRVQARLEEINRALRGDQFGRIN